MSDTPADTSGEGAPTPSRQATSGASANADELDLFRRYAVSHDRRLRNELIERYMGLAAHIAKRYWQPGSEDDIRQVAMIGLVKAVERFDTEYGVRFATFAGSTVEGEVKRYFRDRTWVVRVPRAAKELHLLVRRATEELHQVKGHSPSVDELAAHLRLSRDDVLRGLAASAAYDVGTIDGSTTWLGPSGDHATATSSEESGFSTVADAHAVNRLLDRLPRREREIVRLRFYEDRSQTEIGEALGLSQVHVSRLLRRSFELMRSWLAASDEHDIE